MTFWSCQVGCNFSIGMPSCVAILSLYSQCLLGLALDSIEWRRMNENHVFRCLWSHRCPLVTEINMAEYGSCCTQREVYSWVNRIARAERASIEEVDQPSPYSATFVAATRGRRWRPREIGKDDFQSVLLHPLLSYANRLLVVIKFDLQCSQ